MINNITTMHDAGGIPRAHLPSVSEPDMPRTVAGPIPWDGGNKCALGAATACAPSFIQHATELNLVPSIPAGRVEYITTPRTALPKVKSFDARVDSSLGGGALPREEVESIGEGVVKASADGVATVTACLQREIRNRAALRRSNGPAIVTADVVARRERGEGPVGVAAQRKARVDLSGPAEQGVVTVGRQKRHHFHRRGQPDRPGVDAPRPGGERDQCEHRQQQGRADGAPGEAAGAGNHGLLPYTWFRSSYGTVMKV